MAVTHHRYAVEGWGVGEVWADDGVLLLHDLAGTVPGLNLTETDADLSTDVSGQARRGAAAPLPRTGGRKAPTGTLAGERAREGDGFVSDLCRRFGRHLDGEPVSYEDVRVDESGLTEFQRELLRAL